MKIKITRKSNTNDTGVLDLSKVVAVHIHPINGLEIFSELNGNPATFSEGVYDFHIVEIAGDGKVHLSRCPISEILAVYMSEE